MNKLKEFFELVGVQPNAKFRLRDSEGVLANSVFHFDEWGELRKGTRSYSGFIHRILCGDCEIVLIPFRPQKGEKFYYISCDGVVNQTRFEPNTFTSDATNVALGNCFTSAYVSDEDYQRIKEVFSDVGVDVSEWSR